MPPEATTATEAEAPTVETPTPGTPGPAPEAPTAETPTAPQTIEDALAIIAELENKHAETLRHSRRHEDEAKRLRKLAESSTPQTDTDRLAALEAQLAETRRKAVAAEQGVPLDILRGDTEEELVASAALFRSAVAAAVEASKPAPTPVNDAAASGATGTPVTSSVKQLSRADLEGLTPEEIVAAKAAGQLRELLGTR